MRHSLFVLLLGACTQTSSGELTRIHDQAFTCEDRPTDANWSCSSVIELEGMQLRATGVHNDGSETGPSAHGTLSERAVLELDALISTIPLNSSSESEPGCGGAPNQVQRFEIDFDAVGVREYTVASSTSSEVLELRNYIADVLIAIDTCTPNDLVSFDQCSPQIEPDPRDVGGSRAQFAVKPR